MHLGNLEKINGSGSRTACAVQGLRPASGQTNTPLSGLKHGALAVARLVKTQDVPEAAGALWRDQWTPGGDDAVYSPGVTRGFSPPFASGEEVALVHLVYFESGWQEIFCRTF